MEESGIDYKQEEWKAISLTHVEYPRGDLVGLVLAWCSLAPIFTIISFLTLIAFRRDLHTMSYFLGLVLDEGVNWVLKHTIKESRPVRNRVLFTEYGMPSSHAQFMGFLTSYLLLFMYYRVHHNLHTVENLWKYATCLLSVALSMLVCVSRVYLGYHTELQVGYGVAVGVCLGVLWFIVVHKGLTRYFPAIASWRVSELLMIRDSSLIPNVLWFEYLSHRGEARNRQRKKATARKSS